MHPFVRACGLALTGLAALTAPSSASAQLNAEKMRQEADIEPGLSALIDAAFALRAGNVEFLELGGAVRLEHNTFRARTSTSAPIEILDSAFIVGGIRFKENAGSPIINNGFVHLRWTHMWLPRFGSELFTQFQYDEFLRLRNRALAGLGGRLVPFDFPAFSLALGTGYMFEFEKLDLPDGSTADDETFLHRWTSYASVRFDFADDLLGLTNTIYAQPAFSDFGDFRILDEGELMFRVAKAFALGWSWYLRYDSEPPTEDIVRLDVVFQNTVRLIF